MNWRGWQIDLALAGLAALVLSIAWPMRDFATDDPHITYRYAHNLALGHGLIYNPGEHVLSTTAPFYAVLLAQGARLGADIPALSNALGAMAFCAAASSLFLLGQRHEHSWAGLIAAALCVSAPLLWLTLGLESGLYIALVCWGFWAFDAKRWTLCAILLALATIVRNDGIVATGVVVVAWLIEQRPGKIPWRYLAPYLAIVGVWAVWLAVHFGSPIPVTLAVKSIQARFGLTGFYPGTTFLQGIAILWRAWSEQTPIYWLVLLLALVGTITLRRAPWTWMIAAWGVLMMGAYVALRVAPYPWYYAPLAPLLALLIGLGAERIGRWAAQFQKPAGVLAVVMLLTPLLGAQLFSLNHAARATRGPVPPPEEIAAKVLPEAKTDIYRRVGEWLVSNTPPNASVGVLEVGVLGYYADRRMVDFLGLLQPEVARALARGDIFWAVPAYAPDYLALTAVNPLYSYPILRDTWFQRAYQPVTYFEDARFWGSPVTIYQRTGDTSSLEPHRVERPIMDGVTLNSWAADGPQLQPQQPLRVRLTWCASDPLALDRAQVSVYLVDVAWHQAGQHALRYDTSAWPVDMDVEVYGYNSKVWGAFDVAALSIARRPARYGNLGYIAPFY
jgi:hypothetical protein